jgi:hypothetical protein
MGFLELHLIFWYLVKKTEHRPHVLCLHTIQGYLWAGNVFEFQKRPNATEVNVGRLRVNDVVPGVRFHYKFKLMKADKDSTEKNENLDSLRS